MKTVGEIYEKATTSLKIGVQLGDNPSYERIESEVSMLKEAGMENEEIVDTLVTYFLTSPEHGDEEINHVKEVFDVEEQSSEDSEDFSELF